MLYDLVEMEDYYFICELNLDSEFNGYYLNKNTDIKMINEIKELIKQGKDFELEFDNLEEVEDSKSMIYNADNFIIKINELS